jgi:hypothetical protein
MLSTIAYLASLTPTTSTTVVVPIPPDSRFLEVRVAANWLAASSAGCTVSFSKAADGVTFTASNRFGKTLTTVAAGVAQETFGYAMADDPAKQDPSPVTALRVNLTNNDLVNSALVLIETQTDVALGR